MAATRIEKDSLGEIDVPTEVYWGAQSERARRNFPVSGLTFPRRFIAALGLIKGEAARVNAELGIVEPKLAETIAAAAAEVAEGKLDAHFPLDIFQTGSGTSTNMNANEVIANRAIEMLGGVVGIEEAGPSQRSRQRRPVVQRRHPDGDPRRGLRRARARISSRRSPGSPERWTRRRASFDDIVKIGRTHLQDAMPIRLGQEFSRLRPAGAQRHRAPAGGEAAAGGAGARRHRRRHRHQRAAGIRRRASSSGWRSAPGIRSRRRATASRPWPRRTPRWKLPARSRRSRCR